MSGLQQGMDVIIASRRGAAAVQKVILNSQKDPLFWLKTTFIVVFDEMPQEVAKLQGWYNSAVEHAALPRLEIVNVDGKRGNLNYLRQQGIDKSTQPFVYFQDDDDDLPVNMEMVLRLLSENPELHAVYGVTESVNTRFQLVEQFPPLATNGHFRVDPHEAVKWFPTYAHPVAAVFRRKLFENIPLYDDHLYRVCGAGAFLTRFLNEGGSIAFIPYLVRRVLLHENNLTPPVIDEATCQAFAQDIEDWQHYITDYDVKVFQTKIVDMLKSGEITSFKEIASLVEEKMEGID